ncbi:MAG: pectinesterase family protein [Ignavibacteriales bacterium]|nr:pectinesterase family protein [Ignavibacteriales bacterium]
MKSFVKIFLIIFLLFLTQSSCFTEVGVDLIVAKNGSGNYTTIQEAVNAAPLKSEKPFVIYIKDGVYNEKIFIEKNFITLIGEDRDSTIIIYAELRRNWIAEHPGNDWGSAVINIANGVTNLSIINLTVYNNYGSTHSMEEKPNDHQFAIRGGGTKVVILNCNVKADGGDTLSLWNTVDGMYYHANCYFEGWVDYVCPRGWCYITDSKFYGHNLTASIWHDGSNNPDQKFVIRNSTFDGVKDFPLGRNHRDGQFYLLDCKFSSNMADKPIYLAQPASSYKWGERYFYFNCHRDGGDYNWFANNLNKAPGSPSPKEITAEWTFAGKWNPEKNIEYCNALLNSISKKKEKIK